MSIVVKKVIERLDSKKVFVEAEHNDNLLHAFLVDDTDVETYLNTEVSFEMDYKGIIDWLMIEDFDEWESGLFERNGNIVVKGKAHNLLDVERDTIIDIYIMNGPEFISILSSEINSIIPKIDQGIEVEINGLCIYPVHY